MADDTRQANVSWRVVREDGSVSYDGAQLAVLMDIRDELRAIRSVLQCHNTAAIPTLLRAIRLNTAKPRKVKANGRG